jgi:hypothetical protein
VNGTGNPVSFGFFEETGLYTATGYAGNCLENMVGQVYVHMEPVPGQAAMPEGPGSVCNDEVSDYLTAGADYADNYTWTLEPVEAGILSPDGDECSITWESGFSGAAYLVVTGENDCGTGIPSDEFTVTVNAVPAPSVSGPGYTCDNESADYSTTANSGSNYTWEVTGGNITYGAGTSAITVMWGNPGPGSVTVTEATSAGCETTSEVLLVTIDDCTGLDENSADHVKIYPNPANDKFYISGLTNARVRIYNLLGKEILMIDAANGEQIINCSTFEKGIYLVKVEQSEKMSVFQLVKQ